MAEDKQVDTEVKTQGFVRKWAKRLVWAVSELVIVLTVFVVISIVALGWRLLSAPIDVGFAKDRIEQALKDNDQGYALEMNEILLYWPDFSSPIMLGSSKINVLQNDKNIMSVDHLALGLSGWDLAQGKIRPTSVTIDGPYLHLVRSGETDFSLNIASQSKEKAVPADAAASENLIEDIVEKLSRPIDKTSTNPMAKLERVEIRDAKAMVADQYYGISWLIPKADLVFQRESDGLSIGADLMLPTRSTKSEMGKASLDIRYLRDTNDYSVKATVENMDVPALSARIFKMDWLKQQNLFLTGELSFLMDQSLTVQEARMNVDVPEGVLSLPEQFNKPLNYNSIGLNAAYVRNDEAPDTIKLTALDVAMKDFSASLSANLLYDRKTKTISGPLNASIPSLEPQVIPTYWPIALAEEPATEWMTEKLTGKTYKDAKASVNVTAVKNAEDGWAVDVKDINASFGFEGINIDYRSPLFPIEEANGTGTYKDSVLTIDLEKGRIQDIKINSAKAVLADMHIVGGGTADIDLSLEGQAASVFKYISEEPIGFGKNTDMPIEKIKGHATMNVGVDFPTVPHIRTEDVKVTVDATVKDAFLPNVLRGMPISGGPLKVKLKDDIIKVSGKAKLDGYPIDMSWERFLFSEGKPYVSKVKADLETDEAFREKFGVNLDEIIGSLPLSVNYKEYKNNNADLNVKADITPTKLEIKSLGYMKPVGAEGKASLDVVIKNDKVTRVKNIAVSAQSLELKDVLLNFSQRNGQAELADGTLKNAVVGDNRFDAEFVVDEDDTLRIKAEGERLDARPFLNGTDSGDDGGQPISISATAKEMITHESRSVKNVNLYSRVEADGTLQQLELDAKAGKGAIYLRYMPDQNGRISAQIEADDAGATLYAFGLYDTVKGGKIIIQADEIAGAGKGDLGGKAVLQNFNVVDTPLLAHLLSVMSLTGVGDLLKNEGIRFAKLETDFKWIRSSDQNLLTFKNGRTSGNALGLTFEGRIDRKKKEMKINGTIVPVSMVSDVIGSIPLIGEILTAGSGVFAATYEIKGDTDNPKTSVNPLSVLAPGILRKIFFED